MLSCHSNRRVTKKGWLWTFVWLICGFFAERKGGLTATIPLQSYIKFKHSLCYRSVYLHPTALALGSAAQKESLWVVLDFSFSFLLTLIYKVSEGLTTLINWRIGLRYGEERKVVPGRDSRGLLLWFYSSSSLKMYGIRKWMPSFWMPPALSHTHTHKEKVSENIYSWIRSHHLSGFLVYSILDRLVNTGMGSSYTGGWARLSDHRKANTSLGKGRALFWAGLFRRARQNSLRQAPLSYCL